MSYTPTNIIQSNEYYPYGLQTANSWTRENTTGNQFLGNGGTEFNATSSLYDLDYRNYDPILGRMNGVDPMADKYSSHSPYNFAFNDPVYWNDPSGADPDQRGAMAREEDAQRRAIMRLGTAFASNDMSSIYRGGNMMSFFNTAGGWSVGSGSLSYSSGGVMSPQYLDQRRNDAKAVREGTMSAQLYGEKYGITIKIKSPSTNNSISTSTGLSLDWDKSKPNPIIFFEFLSIPKGIRKTELMQGVRSRLINNGFNINLEVAEYNLIASISALLNRTPNALVLIRGFARGDEVEQSTGGFAALGSNNSVVYSGLGPYTENRRLPLESYIGTTIHELGHAIFSFEHTESGIMFFQLRDSKANFNFEQQNKIKNSIWGN